LLGELPFIAIKSEHRSSRQFVSRAALEPQQMMTFLSDVIAMRVGAVLVKKEIVYSPLRPLADSGVGVGSGDGLATTGEKPVAVGMATDIRPT
tara:strand:+ start:652 stop:930 length:279 start_codon:yes stop_codon:yes gene_type:complete